MSAYYNENDPKAVAWLRELIKSGAIADGEVDERSIEDVRPGDLARFDQCHFFAGIGGWAYALELADWGARPVWTGSCPCQPFSASGFRTGVDDKRHLWPAWFHLIKECRPGVIFGEQVASKDGLTWLDVVQSDLEGADYTHAAIDICAAGFGAPHARQRLYFVADAHGWDTSTEELQRSRQHRFKQANCEARQLALAEGEQHDGRWHSRRGRRELTDRGPWSACDWIECSDGKARPVEPGTFPLAHGLPARMGRLRGYGNAIVAYQAAEFVMAYTQCSTSAA